MLWTVLIGQTLKLLNVCPSPSSVHLVAKLNISWVELQQWSIFSIRDFAHALNLRWEWGRVKKAWSTLTFSASLFLSPLPSSAKRAKWNLRWWRRTLKNAPNFETFPISFLSLKVDDIKISLYSQKLISNSQETSRSFTILIFFAHLKLRFDPRTQMGFLRPDHL